MTAPLPASIVPMQVTTDHAKSPACSKCKCSSYPPSPQRQAAASYDCDTTTLTSNKSSDGGSGGWFSQSSSSASRTRLRRGHGASSSDEVRKRYLHRLGILDDSNEADMGGRVSALPRPEGASLMGEGSGSPKAGALKPSRGSASRSCSSSASGQDKIILLRRSVQYTTKLKSGPAADDDAAGSSDRLASDAHDDDGTALKSPPDEDGRAAPKSSPPSGFELSSAWSSLLSKDSASTTSASVSEPHPYDGAYDLFSLPSDSSIATHSRCDSNRSLDVSALDRLPSSRDSEASSAGPGRRRRKVSFDSTVKAATIPGRLSYSSRMRTRMWSSSEDIYANAVRNEREYVFDGRDWRTASEEGDFLRCSSSADALSAPSAEELVHPVHFCAWPSSAAAAARRFSWQQEQSPLPSAKNGEGDERSEPTDGDYSSGMFDME